MTKSGSSDLLPTVRVERVNHFFGAGAARDQVLFDIGLEIPPGQFVVLTGPSGSGKTTLLTLIGALRSVQSGRVEVLGHDLSGLAKDALVNVRRNIGFVFQLHNLFDSLTVFENVKMAMRIGGCPPADMRRRGAEILEHLGLGHRIDHKPKALSGGQSQRVAVARALVNRPKLVLADEPTASLDRESAGVVINLLKETTLREGCSVIMVTHDSRILGVADRIVNMIDGTVKSDVALNDAVRLCEFLRTVGLFKHLTPTEVANIAEKMQRRVYEPNDIIIREGDPGEEFFLVGHGRVEVRRAAHDGEQKHVATLDAGMFFGERALIADEPRNASCIALGEQVEVFALSKSDFRQALDASASFREQIQSVYFKRH